MCSNYASCYAVAVYLCCQYTPGARDQGTALLLLCVAAVTNADYKTPPPKKRSKIGKPSKTRTKAGKVGTQQLPHFPKILYHQHCAIQRRLPRVAPCRVAGVTTKIIRSTGFLKAGHSVVRVQSRRSVLAR